MATVLSWVGRRKALPMMCPLACLEMGQTAVMVQDTIRQNSASGAACTPLAVVKIVPGIRTSYPMRLTNWPMPALVAWIQRTLGASSGKSLAVRVVEVKEDFGAGEQVPPRCFLRGAARRGFTHGRPHSGAGAATPAHRARSAARHGACAIDEVRSR